MSIIDDFKALERERVVLAAGLFWLVRRVESSRDLVAAGVGQVIAQRQNASGQIEVDLEQQEKMHMGYVAAGVVGCGRLPDEIEALRCSTWEPSNAAQGVLNVYDIPMGVRQVLAGQVAQLSGFGALEVPRASFRPGHADPSGSAGQEVRD